MRMLNNSYIYCMNVFGVWLRACLKKCEALFASKGAGTFLQTKSTKREVVSKGAAVIEFDFDKSYTVYFSNGECYSLSGQSLAQSVDMFFKSTNPAFSGAAVELPTLVSINTLELKTP